MRISYCISDVSSSDRRLPPVKGQGRRSSWPPIVRDFHDASGAEPATVRLGPPTAAAITRMDEAFVWLAWLEPDDARLLWARACGLPWKLLTYRFGASRTTLWRRWVAGLITIASRLRGTGRREDRKSTRLNSSH